MSARLVAAVAFELVVVAGVLRRWRCWVHPGDNAGQEGYEPVWPNGLRAGEGAGQVRAQQVGAGQVGARQVGPPEVGAAQVGPCSQLYSRTRRDRSRTTRGLLSG